MMLRFALLLTLAFGPRVALAQFDHGHAAWGALLKKHVVLLEGGKASQVRYAGLQQDRAALKGYLDTLATVSAAEFKGWSKNQQLAFLINAYNAATIEKILTRYPNIRSVWDFGKLIGNPFKDKFVHLLGTEMSLDNIEHDTIRADGMYNDPRIHFAVNCASVGCPMLREEPYIAERIDQQLDEQTARFLSDRSRNRYSARAKALEVSKIFDWYGDDFGKGYRGIGSLPAFFSRYASLLADRPEEQAAIRQQKVPLRFLDYDWALNAVRS
jgi:hypothetical protein